MVNIYSSISSDNFPKSDGMVIDINCEQEVFIVKITFYFKVPYMLKFS
jgi:hypothetical protein